MYCGFFDSHMKTIINNQGTTNWIQEKDKIRLTIYWNLIADSGYLRDSMELRVNRTMG